MRAVLFAAWAVGVIALVVAGREPDPYLQYVRHIPPPHPYPVTGVSWAVAFLSAQCALIAAILRPSSYKQSWGRALLSLLVCASFFGYAALGAMHAPPYFFVYLWWLLLAGGATLLLSIWSGIRSVRTTHGT